MIQIMIIELLQLILIKGIYKFLLIRILLIYHIIQAKKSKSHWFLILTKQVIKGAQMFHKLLKTYK
jgi:hypothetical protein